MVVTEAGQSRGAVRIRRLLPVTPEVVFAAWTDAQALSQWMSPRGTAFATIDLRVGGRLRVVMSGEGMEIEHTGEYRQIEPPRRLVFTWRSEFTGGEETLVTLEFRREGDQTELLLTHERLPDEQVDSHKGGWDQILERLRVYLDGLPI